MISWASYFLGFLRPLSTTKKRPSTIKQDEPSSSLERKPDNVTPRRQDVEGRLRRLGLGCVKVYSNDALMLRPWLLNRG